jgi:amidase
VNFWQERAIATSLWETEALQLGNITAFRTPHFAFHEWTVSDLRTKMDERELMAHEICRRYIERIEEIDGRGPTLRSVIEVNPDALGYRSGCARPVR